MSQQTISSVAEICDEEIRIALAMEIVHSRTSDRVLRGAFLFAERRVGMPNPMRRG